jgi:hypothetical protein
MEALTDFRAIGRKSGWSANCGRAYEKDFTRCFSGVVKDIARLPTDTAIEGEHRGARLGSVTQHPAGLDTSSWA